MKTMTCHGLIDFTNFVPECCQFCADKKFRKKINKIHTDNNQMDVKTLSLNVARFVHFR